MGIYGRNMKYWMVMIGKTFLVIFGMILAIIAINALASGGSLIEEFIQTAPRYLVMMAALMTIALAYSNICVVFPLTVTFGTRRTPSVVSMLISEHIFVFIAFMIAGISFFYSFREFDNLLPALLPIVIAVVCLMMFLSNLVALLSSALGRVAGMICYFVSIIVVTALSVILIVSEIDKVIAALETGSVILYVVAAIALAVLLDVGTAALLVLHVKKKDLSFT